jgi:putative tricarboxylic transport membrane protein
MWETIQTSLEIVFQLQSLLIIIFSTFMGILIGVIPGLGSFVAIVIMIPFVMNLAPEVGLMAIIGIYVGGMYGGGIASAVLGIPGTPMAAATLLDANPMAERGEAGKAIGLITTASVCGGLISAFILMVFSPLLAKVALLFGPPEYTVLCLMGLSTVAILVKGSTVMGLISAFFGLLVSTVGTDISTSFTRFTFGFTDLEAGIPLLPLLLGTFAVSRALLMVEEGIKIKKHPPHKLIPKYPSPSLMWHLKGTYIRSSLLGVFIGAIPGAGSTIAAYISYSEAKRRSKNPENFGKGAPEGVVAPEAANNGEAGGAMIPMLTLAIPGDPQTAVILGLLFVQGLIPGPNLYRDHGDLLYALFFGMVLCNVAMLFIGMYGTRLFLKLLTVTKSTVLIPILLLIVSLGAYSITASIFDLWIMWVFGIVGYAMNKLKMPQPPIVLGVVLGPILEQAFRRSLAMSAGSPAIFFTRPLAMGLVLFIVFLLLWTRFAGKKMAAKKQETD